MTYRPWRVRAGHRGRAGRSASLPAVAAVVRAGCRGRAGRSASLPAAAAVVRAANRGAWRAARGAAVGRRRRLGSRAAGERGRRPNRSAKPGDAGGRVGVAFVGVCSAVVPSRRSACARMTRGTAVGWGADYELYVMLQSPTSALTPPRIARAPRRRAQPPPLGGGGLRSRVGRPRMPYQRAAGPSPQWVVPQS